MILKQRSTLRAIPFQFVFSFLCLVMAALALPALAQQPAQDVSSPATEEGGQEVPVLAGAEAERFDKMLAGLDSVRSQIGNLETTIEASEGARKEVFQLRLSRLRVELLDEGNTFARAVYGSRDNGARETEYWDQAIAELNSHLDIAAFAIGRLATGINIPAFDAPSAEQAMAHARNDELVKLQDTLFRLMFESMELSQQFGLGVAEQREFLEQRVEQRAELNSALLDAAMLDVDNHRTVLNMLPDDADVKALLSVAKNRVRTLASSLQSAVALMKKLDVDTSAYNRQIISGTGQISSETVSVSVLGSLVAEWTKNLRDWVFQNGPNVLVNVGLFLLFLLVAFKLSQMAGRLVEKGLNRSNVDISQLLHKMLVSVVSKLVLAIGILFALSQIGISLGPVLAGMGVAGFVIGFALQDTLSNFASGMMILIYRPFDVGDVVEAGGVAGTVSHMSLVSTTILTFDNQTLVVPNNKIWGDVIKNVTAQRTRRVDLVFSISYHDDIATAERILQDVVAADERVLTTPEPTIKLHQLADSSVNFIVRPWVNTGDYWGVYWDLTRSVKQRFDAAGITIPFPQMSVHVEKQPAASATEAENKA